MLVGRYECGVDHAQCSPTAAVPACSQHFMFSQRPLHNYYLERRYAAHSRRETTRSVPEHNAGSCVTAAYLLGSSTYEIRITGTRSRPRLRPASRQFGSAPNIANLCVVIGSTWRTLGLRLHRRRPRLIAPDYEHARRRADMYAADAHCLTPYHRTVGRDYASRCSTRPL